MNLSLGSLGPRSSSGIEGEIHYLKRKETNFIPFSHFKLFFMCVFSPSASLYFHHYIFSSTPSHDLKYLIFFRVYFLASDCFRVRKLDRQEVHTQCNIFMSFQGICKEATIKINLLVLVGNEDVKN